ncbi:type II secretion system F family protein [Actinocorallia longicatena]
MNALLLYGGLAAIALALVLLVVAVIGGRRAPTPIEAGLSAIERDYAGKRPRSLLGGPAGEPILMVRFRALALRLSPQGVIEKMQERLDTAGNPGGWTPERILSFKGLGLVGGILLAGLMAAGRPGYGPLMAVAFAAAGFFGPDVLLYNAGLRRQELIRKTLPDVLDLLCVSVESGLGFDAALARVATNTRGPLSQELVRVMQEIQLGQSREDSLKALALRNRVQELRTFVNAMVQAADLGIPVGKVLREQANEMRVKRRQNAEEKAQKLAVKITVPVIFFLFPAMFLVLLGPGVINYLNGGVLK